MNHHIGATYPEQGISLVVYGALAVLATASLIPASATAQTAPNILLVVADDLGIDAATDCYLDFSQGSEGNAASLPNIAASICDRGVVFENAWAQPVCSPSRASLMTGLYAHKTNVGRVIDDPADPTLAPHQGKLARHLREVGYRTAIFGKWHLGDEGTGATPVELGFDLFRGNLNGGVRDYDNAPYAIQDAAAADPTRVTGTGVPTVTIGGATTTYATAVQAADAVDWIAANEATSPGSPWFAWLSYNAPHTPIHRPAESFLDRDTLAELAACDQARGGVCEDDKVLYRAMVNAMDTLTGYVLDTIAALDDDDTIVIFVGDNGTDARYIDNLYPVTAGRGKRSVYESGVRVPLAIAGPGIRERHTSAEPVHIVDLFATIVELAEAGSPTHSYAYDDASVEIPLDSVSLIPILSGTSETVRRGTGRYVLSEFFTGGTENVGDKAAARSDAYKVLCDGEACSSYELYDLLADPIESNDLYEPGMEAGCASPPTEVAESFCSLREVLLARFSSGR